MYITGKYWGNYIGESDDTLTLMDYFEYCISNEDKTEFSFQKIITNFCLDKLDGNFRTSDDIGYETNGIEFPLYYAIDLVIDLAAILLECKKNKSVNLAELNGDESDMDSPEIIITANKSDFALINKALSDFSDNPLEYDLSEMCSEDDMSQMAKICGELRKELFEL